MEKIKYPLKIENMFKLSFKEEAANAISHGIMAIFYLLMLPFVSVRVYLTYNLNLTIAYSVYCIGVFLMFLMSCLYHSMRFDTKQKRIFRILDHCMIYVAIAATFTPICLVILDGFMLWLILITQWLIVLFGIIYKSFMTNKKVKSGLAIYTIMGWSALILIPKLYTSQSFLFLLMLILGGVFYSIGIFFYAKKTMGWFHFIWHLFVAFASIFHFVAVVFLIS